MPVITIVRSDNPEFAKRMDPDYWDPKYMEVINRIDNSKWKVITLGDLNPFMTYGAIVTGAKLKRIDTGVLMIDSPNFKFTGFDFTKGPSRIKPNCKWDKKSSRLKKGDVLIVRAGVASIGRVEIYDLDEVANVGCYVDIFRQSEINPYYLTVYLKGTFGQTQIERLKSGVGTVNINFSEIKSIKIPLLPNDTQSYIEHKYKEVTLIHNKAMKIKEELIRSGLASREAEANREYAEEIDKAVSLLKELINYTEMVIKGEK